MVGVPDVTEGRASLYIVRLGDVVIVTLRNDQQACREWLSPPLA
jgi:hypothetical protein